jgi:hypothetical protein
MDPRDPSEHAPARLGSLEAITTVTGAATDPDGYTLLLNGVDAGRLAVEDTVLLRNLPEAEYAVGLGGLASGCDLGGGNPRGIQVRPDRTTRAIFPVKCD